MLHDLLNRTREALDQRRKANLPRVAGVVAAVCSFVSAYIVVALLVVPDGVELSYHFVREEGVITSLSAILLAAASCFSLAAASVRYRLQTYDVWAWAVMATGFGFLAFDELLQFHERAGRMIGAAAGAGIFRNWNDIIVISYGVIAVPVGIALLPSLVRHKRVFEFFAIGFVLYAMHTIVDSTVEPRTTYSVIVEESCKLFSVAFLALGAFVGFLGVLWTEDFAGMTRVIDPARRPARDS